MTFTHGSTMKSSSCAISAKESSCIPLTLASPFLLASSFSSLRDYWVGLVTIAFKARGMVVDLTRVPQYAIEWVLDTIKELVEEEQRERKNQ
jgi:hypothetical protein